MRLLGCRINGFGKWRDVAFDFTEGVNSFCEENGWGKSTLAGFIKVMLFGFQNERARDELENERRRYAPWDKGIYGGELRFEAGGKSYCVRRTFGKKSLEDEFELLDLETNLESHDFSQNLGEELFQIDAASFARTVFLSQNDCACIATDRINAKIGNLVDNTNDINNFEIADANLKGLLDSWSPTRKTGQLKQKKTQIGVLEQEIRVIQEVQDSMTKLEEKRELCKERKKELLKRSQELEQEQSKVAALQDARVVKREYDSLQDQWEERSRQVKEAEGFFPGPIPKKEELREHIANRKHLDALRKMLDIYTLSSKEEGELEQLREQFAKGVPTEEEVAQTVEAVAQLNVLEKQYAVECIRPEEHKKYEELTQKYAKGLPEPETLLSVRDQYRTYQERRQEKKQDEMTLHTLEYVSMTQKVNGSNGKVQGLISLAAAFVSLALAIYLMLSIKQVLLGCVLLCVAVALGVLGVLLEKKQQKSKASEENPKLQELRLGIEEKKRKINQCREYLEEFCQSYGLVFEEEHFGESLTGLQNDAALLRELSAKENASQERRLQKEIEEKQGKIQGFFSKYGCHPEEASYESSILQFKEKVTEYCRLMEKETKYKATWDEYTVGRTKEKTFLEQLQFPYEEEQAQGQLETIREQLLGLETARREQQTALDKKTSFEQSHDMERIGAIEVSDNPVSLEDLAGAAREVADMLKRVQGELREYDSQLEEKQEKLDDLREKEELLTEMKSQYEEQLKKYQLLTQTKELLGVAKSSFTAKYTEPIMSGFRKYYGIVTGAETNQFVMDANTKVWAVEENKNRDLQFLSTGCQDLTGICLRMALVEAMYTEEKPFLILDDPFVNLDQDKTEGALAFLDEVGREYQILYFTCHESRQAHSSALPC